MALEESLSREVEIVRSGPAPVKALRFAPSSALRAAWTGAEPALFLFHQDGKGNRAVGCFWFFLIRARLRCRPRGRAGDCGRELSLEGEAKRVILKGGGICSY